MISLSCSNITKYYGIDLILDKISFTIHDGERIGLIGDNGTGKSTLFKIIAGLIDYDEGEIFISKEKTIGYLKQDVDYNDDTTIYDACLPYFDDLIQMEKDIRTLEKEISEDPTNQSLLDQYSHLLDDFKKSGGYIYESKIRGVLNGLGFDQNEFDTPVNILSGGQKSRLRLALLLLQNPDILLLDEPTNHLDLKSTDWLESYLLDYQGTVMIVTHDRYFLDKVTNRIIEIENHKILTFEGNYSDFKDYKEELIENQMKKYEKQQKEIEKQKEIIRRFKGRGTEKLAKRAKSREKRLEHLEEVEQPNINNNKISIKFETQIKSGNEVLSVKNLKKSFDELLFKNINFDIFKSERVGLIGPNGIGKTTLFKIILDRLAYDAGEIVLGHHVYPGYYDQEQSNLSFDNTIYQEIRETAPKLTKTEIRTKLGAFLFQGDDVFKEISTLSGGERSRLSILKLMLSKANFLLLDEPTNHLDIKAREVLEKALNSYNGTLLIISHDRYFLNEVTNKTFELSKEKLDTYLGNFDYYIEKKKMNKALLKEDEDDGKTKTQLKKERKERRERRDEIKNKKQRMDDIMSTIEDLEMQLKGNEQLMCKEEIYSDGEQMKKISEENDAIELKINQLYEEWSEISNFIENL